MVQSSLKIAENTVMEPSLEGWLRALVEGSDAWSDLLINVDIDHSKKFTIRLWTGNANNKTLFLVDGLRKYDMQPWRDVYYVGLSSPSKFAIVVPVKASRKSQF